MGARTQIQAAREAAAMGNEKHSPKREVFVRLGAARVQKVLEALDVLKNCANTNTYEYTEDDVVKMETTLIKAVSNTISAFRGEAGSDSFTF